MKKYILSFLLLSIALSAYSQNLRSSKKVKGLSPIELQFTRGGWIPDVGINFYVRPNTILKIDALKTTTDYSLVPSTGIKKYRVGAFLEFRKYKKDSKLYFSHGPAVGYQFASASEYQDNNEFQVGYNAGLGYRISKKLTAGTYINPYLSLDSEGGTDYTHGRLFAGALSNIYLAYRF